MRALTLLVVLLLSRALVAQPPASPDDVGTAELQARIATLEQLVSPYTPSWTWPGYDTPQAFDRLREHMNGDVIHPVRDVSRWSRAELAFHHDREHVEELLAKGQGLPLLKDQRLRDWVRAKSPARAIKNLGRSVKRIVLTVWPQNYERRCPGCDKAKAETVPAAQADGVSVEIRETLTGTVPRIEVEYCDNDRCWTKTFIGFVSYSSIKAAM